MLVGIDAVNVMAVYQPVVQACSSQWRQELQFLPPLWTAPTATFWVWVWRERCYT